MKKVVSYIITGTNGDPDKFLGLGYMGRPKIIQRNGESFAISGRYTEDESNIDRSIGDRELRRGIESCGCTNVNVTSTVI